MNFALVFDLIVFLVPGVEAVIIHEYQGWGKIPCDEEEVEEVK